MEEIISPITIKPKFHIGQIVYLVTDPVQEEYIVTALRIENKAVKYYISHAFNEEIQTEDFEIQSEKIVK